MSEEPNHLFLGDLQYDSMRNAIVSFALEIDGMKTFENMNTSRCDDDVYILDNSPFYAFGVSNGDIITANKIDGRLTFAAVVKRGGHSTYRIKLPIGENHDYFLRKFSPLQRLGCSFEGSTVNRRLLYAIDVKKGIDVRAVYAILQNGEENKIWEFDEGHYYDPQH